MLAALFCACCALPRAAAFQFSRLTYDQIKGKILALKASFPETLTVFTTQERYGLDHPTGPCGSNSEVCEQHVLRVSSVSEEDQIPTLPEGFVSGALHGNERVGPVATLHAVELMLRAHACLASERASSDHCEYLRDFDIDDLELAWLHRLVETRAVYAIPMTNAAGYYRNEREERVGSTKVDPNRDFPYDRKDKDSKCMQTIAARSINELFREHIFQVSITFHGGMEIIAYEWGSTNHPRQGDGDYSPDHTVQADISGALSAYAGSFSSTQAYDFDKMNRKVYPVNGGMEDWAYAASWDNDFTQPAPVHACTDASGSPYKSYPAAKTTYGGGLFRSVNFLVETSNAKNPAASTLGGTDGLLRPAGSLQNGHVARNVRLMLMQLDLLVPLPEWHVGAMTDGLMDAAHEEGAALTVPGVSVETNGTVLAEPEALLRRGVCIGIPLNESAAVLSFAAWGSMHVDSAEIVLVPWPQGRCLTTAEDAEREIGSAPRRVVGEVAADVAGRWGKAHSLSEHSFVVDVGSARDALGSDALLAALRVRVDGNWAKQHAKASPAVPPQTHLVNARSNADWDMCTEDRRRRVQGKEVFYSRPLLVMANASGGEPAGGLDFGRAVVLNPCAEDAFSPSAAALTAECAPMNAAAPGGALPRVALRAEGSTAAPAAQPTAAPTAAPTTAAPTAVPTAAPTAAPTAVPTAAPAGTRRTSVPTCAPSAPGVPEAPVVSMGDFFLGKIGWALFSIPAVAIIFVAVRRGVHRRNEVRYTNLAVDDEEGDLEMEIREA